MIIRKYQVTATTSGSAGTATGSARTKPITGKILAVHLDYTSEPATTDVTVATAHAPVATILTITNGNTDGWFYPRALLQDIVGADLTAIYDPIPIDDEISISVAQADDAGTVVATILVEVD